MKKYLMSLIIGLLVFGSLTGCQSESEKHLYQGAANYRAGNLEQAIADYTKAIELDPDFAVAYNTRGFAYANSGDLEQAIADYDKAIELNPDLAVAYTNRGSAYADSGNLEQAIKDYELYLELFPNAQDRGAVIMLIEGLKLIQE